MSYVSPLRPYGDARHWDLGPGHKKKRPRKVRFAFACSGSGCHQFAVAPDMIIDHRSRYAIRNTVTTKSNPTGG
jgi:hypothetical protein